MRNRNAGSVTVIVIIIIVVIILFLLCCCCCAVSSDDKKSDDTETTETETTETETTEPTETETEVTTAESTTEEITEKDTTEAETTESENVTEEVIEVEPVTETEQETSEESSISVEDIPYHQATDFSVSYRTEYAHSVNSTNLALGENLYVTLEATGDDLTIDDFTWDYDTAYYTMTLQSVTSEDGTFTAKYIVNGIAAGYHAIDLYSNYDICAAGDEDDIYYITFSMNILNADDSTIVYITDTGEKYHYSAYCGGDGSYATTKYDARAVGYEPCGKCAN